MFSILQDGKRFVSFMSQTLGLVADIDLGTEYMRCIGDKYVPSLAGLVNALNVDAGASSLGSSTKVSHRFRLRFRYGT